MALTLKKISVLSNALDIQALKKATSSKDEVKLIAEQLAKVVATLAVDDTSLDTLKEIVEFIKANKETIDALNVDKIIGLKEALEAKLDQATYTKGIDELKASIEGVVKNLTAVKTELESKITTVSEDLTKTKEEVTALQKTVSENVEGTKAELTKNIEANKGEIETLKENSVETFEKIKTHSENTSENFRTISRYLTFFNGDIHNKFTKLGTNIDKTIDMLNSEIKDDISKVGVESYNKATDLVRANIFGTTKKEEYPAEFNEETSKAGDIVVDAYGNLCIVEESKEGEKPKTLLDRDAAGVHVQSYEIYNPNKSVSEEIVHVRYEIEKPLQFRGLEGLKDTVIKEKVETKKEVEAKAEEK